MTTSNTADDDHVNGDRPHACARQMKRRPGRAPEIDLQPDGMIFRKGARDSVGWRPEGAKSLQAKILVGLVSANQATCLCGLAF
ncbi:hypothetical protein VTN77DRAFT_5933 [Rasamsonia byssochlamydoides]|uniref:uncharacterized protein n=1 Tax=Rasamsonia byssochlamydoides TaxID=89139 RepID=UPI003743763A